MVVPNQIQIVDIHHRFLSRRKYPERTFASDFR
jgi:hypothetical protein